MKGFTLIEAMLVIAITLMIILFAIPTYKNLQITKNIDSTVALATQTIRIAQQNSIARVNNSKYGVKFLSNSFVLYQGISYNQRDADYDRINNFDTTINFSTDLINDDVMFSRGLGMPISTGTITLINDREEERKIKINNFGIIDSL